MTQRTCFSSFFYEKQLINHQQAFFFVDFEQKESEVAIEKVLARFYCFFNQFQPSKL